MGRIYLALAEHSSVHAKKACNIFEKGKALSGYQGELSQILIHQADAAFLSGDLGQYAQCLEKGWLIAKKIDSQIRKYEASVVLGKALEKWQNERTYQKLVEIF